MKSVKTKKFVKIIIYTEDYDNERIEEEVTIEGRGIY